MAFKDNLQHWLGDFARLLNLPNFSDDRVKGKKNAIIIYWTLWLAKGSNEKAKGKKYMNNLGCKFARSYK